MAIHNSNDRIMRVLQATPTQLAAIDCVLEGKGVSDKAELSGPVLIRIRTAAIMLDAHRATVWRMAKAGKLKVVEILPGSFRVRRADVEALAQDKEAEIERRESRNGPGKSLLEK